ncbi:phage head completion protein [Oceanobacillus neutriphilus]|uniref:Head-tail adaptor protein n=1 Tax=Oceanobacillus neutriphilus TaxID=531815 RepID=A0ABQ2P442_9BACI|nr:head-tail adaptor protein [Oceanobacillus neutriphilus]GGP17243.1 head-tail adaptor protein [Oceanobacillus neutriphilus]
MARRIRISDLKTRVSFYKYIPKKGPEPGEDEKERLYDCWAKIDSVWLKDIELAKTNGTLEDLTIVMRDPRITYTPSNKHYIEIKDNAFKGKRYNVKSVQPDMQDKQFITVIAELVAWE